MEHIVDRMLLLARVERTAGWIRSRPIAAGRRSSRTSSCAGPEVGAACWRLGAIADVTLDADETWLRAALDALIEKRCTTPMSTPGSSSARGGWRQGRDRGQRRRPRDPGGLRTSRSSSGSPDPTRRGRAGEGGVGPRALDRGGDRHGARRLVLGPQAPKAAARSFELRLPLRPGGAATREDEAAAGPRPRPVRRQPGAGSA